MGMPETLYYERSGSGAGLATFRFASGALASLALTRGASSNGGMERTVIVSDRGQHITVENNLRVTLHRSPPLAYGASPDFFVGKPEEASAVWGPGILARPALQQGTLPAWVLQRDQRVCPLIHDLEARPPRKGTFGRAAGRSRASSRPSPRARAAQSTSRRPPPPFGALHRSKLSRLRPAGCGAPCALPCGPPLGLGGNPLRDAQSLSPGAPKAPGCSDGEEHRPH